MSGHSPGPWSMCDPYRIQPVGEWAVQIENEMQMIGEVYECDDLEEMQANGRLFAAAPDLLAACEAMLHRFGHLDCDPGKREAVDLAVAAIKKAERK